MPGLKFLCNVFSCFIFHFAVKNCAQEILAPPSGKTLKSIFYTIDVVNLNSTTSKCLLLRHIPVKTDAISKVCDISKGFHKYTQSSVEFWLSMQSPDELSNELSPHSDISEGKQVSKVNESS